jgi:MFS family permease
VLAGSLLGPLIGGILPGLIGIRATFFLAGGVIFLAFLATVFLIQEDKSKIPGRAAAAGKSAWSKIPDHRPVIAMLITSALVLLANMSIEPIISVYVGQLTQGQHVIFTSGLVMAAAAVGSMLAAPRLGKLADRIGPWKLIVYCLVATGLLLIPQAFVTNSWQLLALRFCMGISLAGLMPAVAATIRHSVPEGTGTILGYNTSAQYTGQVLGPLLGGFAGGHFGMRPVFLLTALVMFGGAGYNWVVSRRVRAS